MQSIKDTLVIIPARGGSKGLPGKNIKPLNGKPLIHYTIEAALDVTDKEHICVTTDDKEIIKVAEQTGIKVPFIRPAELATDTANTWDVVKHAIDWYRANGKVYSKIILLQPTSPFRTGLHINEAFKLMDKNTEMVVSVKETKSNPYFTLFEEDDNGFIHQSKQASFTRRQDCPPIYELNGAIYILNLNLNLNLSKPWNSNQIKKYTMTAEDSIDIDNEQDWDRAEKKYSYK
ncbi:acylneuraminate cytidylyltransferase family protein [Carboxylicivirga sp. A043]|uniref:acylneuraminate cytidylyltransferase family protein n=1 Tax=Carboxylicivirga litoralis TaxID=2816963 RepID=UPI0021CB1576|nr:acylneuraminate cytidylyltransferase family protein [Carboxylicivirga sp. A043]MCU4158141.1 acylneuraminate cytidylyltransferase family protein [Carboxylicivirga sp. A043]